MKPRARWTFMVYMAGDNNLERAGVKDLQEMKAIGSSADVAVVARFDRMSDQVTRRYYLTDGGNLVDDCREELPEANTGDPRALVDFVVWACANYPAERYALVLWNHGAGWKDDDIYHLAAEQGASEKLTRGEMRGLTSGRPSRALFRPSIAALIDDATENGRAILFDDTSADFLDSVEMRQALAKICDIIGHPVDLLGFDACLMSMLEVGYQVRGHCQVFVGSQETEPGDGWPYDSVVAVLTRNPDMDGETLARCIVPAYTDFYREHGTRSGITQSAVRASALEPICETVSELADTLIPLLDDVALWGRLSKVQRDVQRFTDREYVDLRHLADLIATGDQRGKPGKAARALAKALSASTSPVLAESHLGATMEHATGVSVYLPSPRRLSSLYANLDFARDYRWSAFLEAYVGAV